MKITNRWLLPALVLMACVIPEADASNWKKCWTGSKVKWSGGRMVSHASAIGFPPGSVWADALSDSYRAWNLTASRMTFGLRLNNQGIGSGNGESEVWWASGMSALAVARTWYNPFTCNFMEADLIFNVNAGYTPFVNKFGLISHGGCGTPLQPVALHELGHAQGLLHSRVPYSIMGDATNHTHVNGSTASAYPGVDALQASIETYGLVSSAPEDVGVTHFRWVGSAGDSSLHGRCRIFDDASGSVLPQAPVPGSGCPFSVAEPVFLVNKGQTVRFETTYENMGRSFRLVVPLQFFLSTNDTISVFDTPLGGSFLVGPLTRNVPFTISQGAVFTIPTTLVSGRRYFLGAILDPNNTLSETDRRNNATYTAIQIR